MIEAYNLWGMHKHSSILENSPVILSSYRAPGVNQSGLDTKNAILILGSIGCRCPYAGENSLLDFRGLLPLSSRFVQMNDVITNFDDRLTFMDPTRNRTTWMDTSSHDRIPQSQINALSPDRQFRWREANVNAFVCMTFSRDSEVYRWENSISW